MKKERVGTVQVYTGEGKGKTTAAIGLAIRALGHGWKVLMVQFLKGDTASWAYGEIKTLKRLSGIKVMQFGSGCWVKGNPSPEDLDMAKKAWQAAREATLSGKYNLVILDEVNVAVSYGMVSLDDVLELIKNKPRHIELVLTGRHAPQAIIEAADLVSEISPVKHYHKKGIKARPGIEY